MEPAEDSWRFEPELGGASFEELAAGYFVDLALMADATRELLRTKQRIPKTLPVGFDGRLYVWLQDRTLRGINPDTTWPIVLRLIDEAPSEDRLVDIGAGPLEDLIRSGGSAIAVLVVNEADRSQRFRMALRHVWPGDGAPPSVLDAIARARTEPGYRP